MTTESTSALQPPFHEHVTRGELAGFIALVWRPSQPTHCVLIGRRDVERELPITRDTIFRIASATKPITTVAALALLDDGRFGLDDSVTRVAPELEHLRVLDDPEGPLDRTVPA